jgi:hypothetical protein
LRLIEIAISNRFAKTLLNFPDRFAMLITPKMTLLNSPLTGEFSIGYCSNVETLLPDTSERVLNGNARESGNTKVADHLTN